MRTISFIQIEIKNFKSYIKADIIFPDTDGLKLLSGNNLTQPRLGANGCGKTSFLDAICWCITGYATNGDRISSVVNWDATDVEVRLTVLINNTYTVVKRYGPPMRIELNGETVPQDKIDALFGLTRLRFNHSIIFGQGQDLFPDLSIPERGDLLDEVLGLSVWQKATEAAGNKCTELEKLLSAKKTELAYTNGRIASLPTDTDIEADIKKWEEEKIVHVSGLEASQKKWSADRASHITLLKSQELGWADEQIKKTKELEELREKWKEEKINLAESKVHELESLEASLAPLVFEVENHVKDPFAFITPALQKQVNEWEALKAENIKKLHEAEYELGTCDKAEALWQNDTCPTCLQKIAVDKKAHEIVCISNMRAKIEITRDHAEKAIKELTVKIEDYTKQIKENTASTIRSEEKKRNLQKEIDSIRRQVSNVEGEARRAYSQYENDPYTKQIDSQSTAQNPYEKQVLALERQINPYAAQIMMAKAAINPNLTKLDKVRLDRAELTKKQVAQQNEYNDIAGKMTAAEFWKHGFKRIRLYFVKQVLLTLEIEIQSAVSALGLESWKVSLSTESETKSATIKLGVQIHIESPEAKATWNTWSGGEKQRLRLAIAMGLASLIQRAAGVWITLEVWDEPTQHLSGEGIRDVLDILHHRAEVYNKQIWVVDHSALQYSGFSEIWTVVKDSEGSRLVLSERA